MSFPKILTVGAALMCIFFSSASASWTLHRDFNGGEVGTRVTPQDGFDSAQGKSFYSREHVFEGPYAAQLNIVKGTDGWGTWGGVIDHPERLQAGDELWYRVRMWFPSGFDYFSYGAGNRLKIMRVHTIDGLTGKHEGYNDILIDWKSVENGFVFGFEGELRWSPIGKKADLPRFDRWETYELYIKFHPVPKASGGEAVVRFWKNGELLIEIADRKTLLSMSSEVTRSLLFTYWNGGAPQTQSMWVDDIVLTSDVPSGRDVHGNPFIGEGAAQLPSPPTPPLLEVLQSQ